MSALGIAEFRFRAGHASFFVGLGAGYALIGDGGEDRILTGNAPVDSSAEAIQGRSRFPAIAGEVSSTRSRADRGAFLLGGAVGFTVHVGRSRPASIGRATPRPGRNGFATRCDEVMH